MSRSLRIPARLLGLGCIAVAMAGLLTACPAGKCFMRFQEVDKDGKVKSDKCLIDTCPKGADYIEAKKGCECKAGTVTLAGACMTEADANASCGKAYQYSNGACVARACAAGQILNATSGACENKRDSDQAVAAQAGVTLKEGQSVGCPAGYTYVLNDKEGACVPNELTCSAGTKYDGKSCVAVSCPAGTVFDSATGQCNTLKTGEDQSAFSVQAKLNAAMGPQFCASHAKNPGGFNVKPGQSQTIKVTVTIQVPGNQIEQTSLVSVRTTNVGGAELTPQVMPGVANVNKQVNEQVVPGIRALGGKSIEAQATAEVTCVIKRAPIQVIETHGGGV